MPQSPPIKIKISNVGFVTARKQIVNPVNLFLRLNLDGIMANSPSTKCIPVDACWCPYNFIHTIHKLN